MPKGQGYGYEGMVDNNDKSGYGNKHGSIASPQGPCGYEVQAGSGPSQKGGEPSGSFGQHMQTPGTALPIVGRDGMQGAPQGGFGEVGRGGGISTPMDTSTSAMPGVSSSSGTGPTTGGGAKISTPWGTGPFGEMAG